MGTAGYDESQSVSADSLGNVFVSGVIGRAGPAGNQTSDAFVSRYDSLGNLTWTRRLHAAEATSSTGVSADGLGNVYVSGYTIGSLAGPNAGSWDAFLRKYDSLGNLAWSRQWGTTSGDFTTGVSADALGNVYVSGFAGFFDAFVTKFDSLGNHVWTRELATDREDRAEAVSADGLGNVYISGFTGGSLEGPNAGVVDAFVCKYDAIGNLVWIKQLGSARDDRSESVAADKLGNVYISGLTFGSLAGPVAGLDDAFISKFDSLGNHAWTRQLDFPGPDGSYAVAADQFGNAFITGFARPATAAATADAFVAQYDSLGNLAWWRQFGSTSSDSARSISIDGLGALYIAGETEGSLGATNTGSSDAFVAKFFPTVVPEPTALMLAALALELFSFRRN